MLRGEAAGGRTWVREGTLAARQTPGSRAEESQLESLELH